MALFRKLFYRKPPDGLLEICDQVFVFDCCFSTDAWEEQNYKVYMGGVVGQLREHFPEASFLVFNFREVGTTSLMADVLSEYDMTIMDYPRHYEGCPLLPMEVMHHFLRSSESWLALGPNNLLLMHCERGAWPVLAFMLAALLIYQKQYSGEYKTLDMIYKQAPRELLHLLAPLNPLPSQLRYLQYVSRRNLVSEWPPLDRALAMDCIIMRFIPDFDGERGCRPIFRIYGQDPFLVEDKSPKVVYSTPKKGKPLRAYKQAESELVKIDINCHVQGDVVVECLSLTNDMEKEVMMFRVVFNTAFIRSNILMLNRDEVDILWDAKERFPKNFRVELLFSEMDAASSVACMDFSHLEEKGGLPMEAFSKVHEIFSQVDWEDHTDAARNMLQHLCIANVVQEKLDGNYNQGMATSPRLQGLSPKKIRDIMKHAALENNSKVRVSSVLEAESVASPKKSPSTDVNEKLVAEDLHAVLQLTSQANTTSQQRTKLSPQESPSLTLFHHSATVKPLLGGSETSENAEVSLPKCASPTMRDQDEVVSSKAESVNRKDVSVLPSTPSPPAPPRSPSTLTGAPSPPPPPPITVFAEPSKQLEHSLIKQAGLCSQDSVQALLTNSTFCPETPSGATSTAPPTSGRALSTLLPAPPPPPPPTLPHSEQASNTTTSPPVPPPPPLVAPAANSLPNSLQASSAIPATLPRKQAASDVASIPAQPPPPKATPHSNGNSDTRVATPAPPPPPSPSGKTTGPTVSSSPKPPPPPPAPISPSTHTGAPSAPHPPPPPPPPPLSSGKGTPTASSSPKPPPPPPTPVSPSTHTGAPPPPPPLSSGKGTPKMGTDSSPSAATNVPPTPAPPLGPPSSGKGRMLRAVNSRSHQTKKLKPLHWLKLTRAVQGSLWAETQKSGEASKAPEIDMTELESLFSASAPNTEQGGKSKLNNSRGPKSEKVQLIEHRRAYNCEIMLSQVKVPLQDLMNSVLNLEESALDADQVENLIKFCPTKEEMELLKGYSGDKDKLGKCELFFLELMKVPRVEMKLRVFSFKIQFRSQVSDLRNSLSIVNSAAEQIKNSVKFKRIMQTILSLGNALNQGTARGAAIGFRLGSLLKLSETRARNNRITLMHYLCKILAEKLPEVLDFGKDLACLEPAAKIQLKFLAEEMQAINKGLEKVVQELSLSENDGLISHYFHKTLKEFLHFAEAEVRSLASLYSGVGRNVDALILYFGEDPAKCPFEQVVSTLLNFVRLFNRAHEENCKQLEIEMKKAAEDDKFKTEASDREGRKSVETPGQGGMLNNLSFWDAKG